MKTRLLHLWDRLSSSYWFVPTTMVLLAGILAFGVLWIDRWWKAPVESDWIYTGGAAGARALLSTVAGSVITVAGVVFSITIATLTQASSQFGPRLLRNFMRDLGNQVVLGTFVATFFYCLLILRAIRGQDDITFVPNLSITVAVLMAIASLAVLIYYIDHISRALQGPQVVAGVGMELQRALLRPFPAHIGEGSDDAANPPQPPAANSADTSVVLATAGGYLQAIDDASLFEIAQRHDLVLHLDCRPGDYIMRDGSLLHIEGKADEELRSSLANFFILGKQRTAEQDAEYSIRQLVEIAVRALSPGINDPFTAINCIDWLGAAISIVAKHGLPSAYRHDAQGKRRIVARVSTFAGLTDAAFNQIRQFGGGSVAVTLRLLEVIAATAGHLRSNQQRKVLLHHVEMIYEQSRMHEHGPCDQSEVKARYDLACTALNPRNGQPEPAV